MSNILLHTNQVAIGYRNKKQETCIAKDVNIELREGELVSLVGANGIGKSTLLRTIAGIQKPLSGTVYLEEVNLFDLDAVTLAQKISVVLTEKLPPSNLTVWELIALGRQPYTNWIGTLKSDDIEAVNSALELTQISHLATEKHFEISDGQLQKVMIARALAQNTQIIILDEPTTHLDLQHKASLFNLLKKLTKTTNKCILFSTHEIDMAIQMSDQMIVMTNGKAFQNTPCNLISSGIFQQIFSDDNIHFDNNTGKFVLKQF